MWLKVANGLSRPLGDICLCVLGHEGGLEDKYTNICGIFVAAATVIEESTAWAPHILRAGKGSVACTKPAQRVSKGWTKRAGLLLIFSMLLK